MDPQVLAEGAGFEPAIRFPVYTLSRRAPSTARPPLLIAPGATRSRAHITARGRGASRRLSGSITQRGQRRGGLAKKNVSLERLAGRGRVPIDRPSDRAGAAGRRL